MLSTKYIRIFRAKLKHMKQLIIILSITLCIITTSFSQSTITFPNDNVDFFQLLELPKNIGEEEFLGELDKFFRQSNICKGYGAWQLHGYDFTNGTFFLAEFFPPHQTAISGKGEFISPIDAVDSASKSGTNPYIKKKCKQWMVHGTYTPLPNKK